MIIEYFFLKFASLYHIFSNIECGCFYFNKKDITYNFHKYDFISPDLDLQTRILTKTLTMKSMSI